MLQVTRKEKGMATYPCYRYTIHLIRLQVTRKEKGMATKHRGNHQNKIIVASDPKREGYGNAYQL
ncbi:hypothetical protein [Methanospirillum purgamenti]|uniref:hypothetical protein n=2 Tax=Methanospirillum purgamenti TaxID=2834276 RepID=UPI0039B7453D